MAARDRFVVGIDFGTASGRAVVVRARDGELAGVAQVAYADGVIAERLPVRGGAPLPPEWALQNPRDYLLVLEKGIARALRAAGVRGERVIGLGTAFTCSSPLPTTRDGTPLCFLPAHRRAPHAWVKLWKHHAAQPQADRITELGRERQEEFVRIYGGRYSAEWFFAKLLQIAQEDAATFAGVERFIEAADWIAWQLTGQERRSACAAGYKAMLRPEASDGGRFPAPEFFRLLHPGLARVVGTRMPAAYYPLGAPAGGLTPYWAARTGLAAGTPVAVGNVDAHAAVPACGVTVPGRMVMVMGTSICHLVLGRDRRWVEGMCGVVADGVVPGLWGYEAGQSAVGDIFAWFFAHALSAGAARAARRAGQDAMTWVERRAAALAPGAHGLVALDWWNGNRSVLVNASLSGLLLGLGLDTRPEEIYRALIEATAFGTRQIVAAFEAQGVTIAALHACGGLAERNRLLMQIYADVTDREIFLPRHPSATSALGAALHAAVAAGTERGGHASIAVAAARMAGEPKAAYRPRPEARAIYDRLFAEYRALHDYFGRGGSDVMRRLKALRDQSRAGAPRAERSARGGR